MAHAPGVRPGHRPKTEPCSECPRRKECEQVSIRASQARGIRCVILAYGDPGYLGLQRAVRPHTECRFLETFRGQIKGRVSAELELCHVGASAALDKRFARFRRIGGVRTWGYSGLGHEIALTNISAT